MPHRCSDSGTFQVRDPDRGPRIRLPNPALSHEALLAPLNVGRIRDLLGLESRTRARKTIGLRGPVAGSRALQGTRGLLPTLIGLKTFKVLDPAALLRGLSMCKTKFALCCSPGTSLPQWGPLAPRRGLGRCKTKSSWFRSPWGGPDPGDR